MNQHPRSNLYSLRGKSPTVHPDCYIAPTAVISGDVVIASGTAVLHGSVITAESALVEIGSNCVIMEHAVVRGAGGHPTLLGDRVLVGPHSHITGARIASNSMVATNAVVFNGADIGAGTLIAIGAIVHIKTRLPPNSRVPMYHIAVGEPAEIFAPHDAPRAHQMIADTGFTRTVFNHDTSQLSFGEAIAWMCDVYSRALRHHGKQELECGPHGRSE